MNPALLVLAAWLCAALVCLGLGATVAALLRVRERKVGVLFWLGFASTLALLQIWHLFLPVGDAALVTLSALALLGLVLARPSLASLRDTTRRAGWHPILVTAAAVWLADRATQAPGAGADLSILHAVRWIEAHPIIPGLGNLHDGLASQDAYRLWLALLSVGPFEGRPHLVANGILLLAAFSTSLGSLLRIGTHDLVGTRHVVQLFLLPPLVEQALDPSLRLPDPRVATVALGAGLVALVVRELCDVDPESSRTNRTGVVAVLLSCAAVVLHAPMLLVAAPFGAAAAFVLVRRRPTLGTLVTAFAVVVALIGPWLIRGFVLSGYPIHPFAAFGGVPVWSVPPSAIAEARQALAATPLDQIPLDADVLLGRITAGWTWGRLVVVPAVMAALFLVLYVVLRVFARGTWPRGPVLAFLPALTATALWVLLSGDVREGMLLPWLVAGQCCALIVGSERRLDAMGWRQSLVIAIVLCAGLSLPNRRLAPVWVEVLPGLPSAIVRTERVGDLDVEIARDVERCPSLVCAPQVPHLRMREPGNVVAGFVAE